MKRLFCSILGVLLLMMVLIACGKAPSPKIKLTSEEEGPKFTGRIVAENLKKNSSYVLSINGKVGKAGNNLLLKYGNWSGEGYHDFKQVETDDQGHFSSDFSVELPESTYDVTFVLKDVSDKYKPIFYKNYVKFTIKK